MLSEKDRARAVMSEAVSWIANNPRAWAAICTAAAHDYERGRRISIAHYVEDVRAKDYATLNGERFAINNSFIPVFARILIASNPCYRKRLEIRRSRFDEVFAGGE